MSFPISSFGRSWNKNSIEAMNLRQQGVYGIYNATFWLYIGQAEDMRERLLEHYNKTSDQSACIWKNKPTLFKTMLVSSSSLVVKEQELIKEYNPICNRT